VRSRRHPGYNEVVAIVGGREKNGQYASDKSAHVLVPKSEYDTRGDLPFVFESGISSYTPVEV